MSRLEALGASLVPPPSGELADRLRGERLPRRERTRHVVRFPVVLPAAAIAAALVGFFLVAVDHGSSTSSTKTIVVQNAVDASVEIEGAATPARTGSTLRDGAIVTVGPSGSITGGGVTLGPGERAVVRAGRLQRLRALRAVATEWQKLPVGVDLEGRRTSSGVVLSWSAYEGTGGAAHYVVFREDRTVVARRLPGGRLMAADRASPAGGARYLVVVLDAQGGAIARSQVLSI
jgi:hypothetical protein